MNTGYKINPTKKKVTDDVNEYPLDVNNNLCSVTGLPQDTMSNTDTDRRVYDDVACPIILPTYSPRLTVDDDSSYCEITFTSSETGIIVVDMYDIGSSVELYAQMDTPGVSENALKAHTGANFAPPELSGNPGQCLMLASDYITTGGSLRWRFEFNVAKMMSLYPSIEVFVFKIFGVSPGNSSGGTGAYSLKGADQGEMIMYGSPGSYIPSNANTNSINLINTTYFIPQGIVSGNFDSGVTVCTFTYNRTSKTLTKT